jgi:hypothetical protein
MLHITESNEEIKDKTGTQLIITDAMTQKVLTRVIA